MTKIQSVPQTLTFPHICPAGDPVVLPDAQLWWQPDWLAPEQADAVLEQLGRLHWAQQSIKLFGKTVPSPRLQGWYGDPGVAYRYSGLDQIADGWPAPLAKLRDLLSEQYGLRFNSVLANRYRNEQDSMGWHRDNEPELGEQPTIASISLGAERLFQMQHVKHALKYQMPLTHGSLLIMSGKTQQYWRHAVPKSRKPCSVRINLTFRSIHQR